VTAVAYGTVLTLGLTVTEQAGYFASDGVAATTPSTAG